MSDTDDKDYCWEGEFPSSADCSSGISGITTSGPNISFTPNTVEGMDYIVINLPRTLDDVCNILNKQTQLLESILECLDNNSMEFELHDDSEEEDEEDMEAFAQKLIAEQPDLVQKIIEYEMARRRRQYRSTTPCPTCNSLPQVPRCPYKCDDY